MRRLFLLVVVAAISLGAAEPPKPATQAQQNQAGADLNSSTTRIVDAIYNVAVEKDAGCEDRSDKRASDLCAQWGAVDAARRAAMATWFAVLLSFIGTLLVALTFWEQRKVARAELRAYLVVEPKGILEETEKEGGGQIAANLLNKGKTPAYGVHVAAEIAVGDPNTFVVPEVDVRPEDDAEISLGPGHSMHVYGKLKPLSQAQQNKIANCELAIIAYGAAHYKDCFGRPQYTRFSFYHWGPELSPDAALRTRKGNDSS